MTTPIETTQTASGVPPLTDALWALLRLEAESCGNYVWLPRHDRPLMFVPQKPLLDLVLQHSHRLGGIGLALKILRDIDMECLASLYAVREDWYAGKPVPALLRTDPLVAVFRRMKPHYVLEVDIELPDAATHTRFVLTALGTLCAHLSQQPQIKPAKSPPNFIGTFGDVPPAKGETND